MLWRTCLENAEAFINKKILPNIDEDKVIRELIYVLYIQAKNITKVGTLDKFFGDYLHNFFILSAYLWLYDGAELKEAIEAWKEHHFDLVGLLEIGEILDERRVYSKNELFIKIKNKMIGALKKMPI